MNVKKLPNGGEIVTFTTAEMDAMLTRIAKDHGMTLAQYKAATAKDLADNWCKCQARRSDLLRRRRPDQQTLLWQASLPLLELHEDHSGWMKGAQ